MGSDSFCRRVWSISGMNRSNGLLPMARASCCSEARGRSSPLHAGPTAFTRSTGTRGPIWFAMATVGYGWRPGMSFGGVGGISRRFFLPDPTRGPVLQRSCRPCGGLGGAGCTGRTIEARCGSGLRRVGRGSRVRCRPISGCAGARSSKTASNGFGCPSSLHRMRRSWSGGSTGNGTGCRDRTTPSYAWGAASPRPRRARS